MHVAPVDHAAQLVGLVDEQVPARTDPRAPSVPRRASRISVRSSSRSFARPRRRGGVRARRAPGGLRTSREPRASSPRASPRPCRPQIRRRVFRRRQSVKRHEELCPSGPTQRRRSSSSRGTLTRSSPRSTGARGTGTGRPATSCPTCVGRGCASGGGPRSPAGSASRSACTPRRSPAAEAEHEPSFDEVRIVVPDPADRFEPRRGEVLELVRDQPRRSLDRELHVGAPRSPAILAPSVSIPTKAHPLAPAASSAILGPRPGGLPNPCPSRSGDFARGADTGVRSWPYGAAGIRFLCVARIRVSSVGSFIFQLRSFAIFSLAGLTSSSAPRNQRIPAHSGGPPAREPRP